MKKQLSEIALPSAPRPGLNIKQTFKGVLADADSREKWMSRFTYWLAYFFPLHSLSLMDTLSLRLLRTFYTEDLVDHRTFLTWLVQQMITCNLAQAGFLTRLTDEYANDILTNRALARPLAEACLAKLSEVCGNTSHLESNLTLYQICTTPAHEFLKDTEDILKALIQVCWTKLI